MKRKRAPAPLATRGELHSASCLGCIDSALAGKSDGRCYGNVTGARKRCFHCAKGNHPCALVPVAERVLARALVAARVAHFHGSETLKLVKTLKVFR